MQLDLAVNTANLIGSPGNVTSLVFGKYDRTTYTSLSLDVPKDGGGFVSVEAHAGSTNEYDQAVTRLRDDLAQAAADQAAREDAARRAQQAAAQAAADQARAAAERDAQARLDRYRQTCRAHTGTLSQTQPDVVGYDSNLHGPTSEGEYCVVTYGGEGSFLVRVDVSDGSFDQTTADDNHAQCESDAAEAKASADDGRPWAKQPEYHAASGVCFEGAR